MRSRGDDFKPIRPESRLTAKAACDYTERPEVTAAPPTIDGSTPSSSSKSPRSPRTRSLLNARPTVASATERQRPVCPATPNCPLRQLEHGDDRERRAGHDQPRVDREAGRPECL